MDFSRFVSKELWAQYYEKYERLASSIAFVFGFVVDSLTLKRIDLLFENIVLGFYIAVAAASIAVFNLWEYGRLRGRLADYVAPWLPVVMQIAFGGLFSGYVVVYARSSSVAASWLFLLLLGFLLVGNEFFRKRYQQFIFQISIFYIAVFAFAIFSVPVATGKLGAGVFVASGLLSLVLISAFLYVFLHAMPARVGRHKTALMLSIGGIYAAMHVLYFANIVPPIPLALKEDGVYHAVMRAGEEYRALAEERVWYAFLPGFQTLHLTSAADSASFYSAVFAPTKLAVDIVHEWQYFDGTADAWVTRSRILFPIAGGRDGGYRGYSTKTGLTAGLWRVSVETARGQVLGRRRFRVEYTADPPPVHEVRL